MTVSVSKSPDPGSALSNLSDEVPERVFSRPAFRLGPISIVLRPSMLTLNAILFAVLLLLLCINIGRGDYPLSIGQVTDVLLGGGTKIERFIVIDLRLPRSLVGLLVGLALGMAGAITQSIARNPLASPDILGITAGASATAVWLIVLGDGSLGGVLTTVGLPLAALLGGVLTAVAIYLLAWRNGVEGFRLILVGIGMEAALLACPVAGRTAAVRSSIVVAVRRRAGVGRDSSSRAHPVRRIDGPANGAASRPIRRTASDPLRSDGRTACAEQRHHRAHRPAGRIAGRHRHLRNRRPVPALPPRPQ